MDKDILETNKNGWDKIATEYFGTTALPEYGPLVANEEELGLLKDIHGKRVLDIGCGSGHSLEYMNKNGAAELWGLDLSSNQIETARNHLKSTGENARLHCAPMEEDIGLPKEYFDIVYSIYALGWTTNLKQTLALVHSYLKKDGIFVFSWDHPMFQCIDEKEGDIFVAKSYLEEGFTSIKKNGEPLYVNRIKIGTYISELSKVGFKVECLIEGDLSEAHKQDVLQKSRYYSFERAKMVPSSFIIKAVKI